jgi:hypothetical protein
MDPYLEAHWGDVHTRLTTYACDQLQPQMPPGLRVSIEEYVTVLPESEVNGEFTDSQRYAPDVRVVDQPAAPAAPVTLEAKSTATQPRIVKFVPPAVEPVTGRNIRIVNTHSRRGIVTAIEFLSRTNKVGEYGQVAYLQKQGDFIRGGVNLVEIDLLCQGDYILAVPGRAVPAECRVPYRICVTRATRANEAEMYPVSLRQRLPSIAIPLRPGDRDACLDLQAIVNLAYENGRYDGAIDYRADPEPQLEGDDAAWADKLLREQGKR